MTSGVIQKCVSTHIVKVGSFTVQYHQWYNIPGTTTEHFDISGGYYFVGATPVDIWAINLPEKTSSAIMTINLDSITANSYSLDIGLHNTVYDFRIIKSTTGGVVSWEIKKGSTVIPLYYDPSRSDNSYQIKIDFEHTRNYMVGIYEKKEYKTHYEFRYVGSWPTLIGEANYYQKYTLDVTNTRDIYDPDDYMDRINLAYPNHTAPYYNSITVRMDAALFAGTEYPVISNNEYDPAAFRTNPSTTIKNITQYGNSIIFAGETYTVGSDGNITVGTHKVSLDGIVLDSVPVAGGYENRINGYVISTTADPSTIQFKGAWVASVATDSQSINTYQTTVWHAGEFAWDGMDQNFLIVGLITSLGVFIGLGIYARKSNSKGVIPLMIVCGGAAVLFFIML